MKSEMRAAMGEAAVKAAKAVGYSGAGTVEFIADASEGLKADRFWFMEMNTRLQVEHPVTEAITGFDLVEWQLRVASGEPLPLSQDQIAMRGHAVEARLYAEDPAKGFLPSTGPLTHFVLPTAVRVDSGVDAGGEIGPWYDPMIAKLIAQAPSRAAAIARLAAACADVEVWPVKTNAGFLARLLAEPDFAAGEVDTGFIESRLQRLAPVPPPPPEAAAAAARALLAKPDGTPWASTRLAGFRVGAGQATGLLQSGGQEGEGALDIESGLAVTSLGQEVVVFAGGDAWLFGPRAGAADVGSAAGDGQVLAPMPGRIAAVPVMAGEAVARGQTLATLEAMKMEHALVAPFDGVVADLRARVGDQVTEGALLVRLEPAG